MTDLSSELRKRLAGDSPHRLAYYESVLNRIASEVGGNAKFHGERVAAVLEEVSALRADLATVAGNVNKLTERVDRMAEFLTKLKAENGKPTKQ